MLELKIEEQEFYDESRNEFVTIPARTLQLEHSLISISKWESKWGIPFLGKDPKTDEMVTDYIREMTITKNVPDIVYDWLSVEHRNQVSDYLTKSQTATRVPETPSTPGVSETITSELVYYWMISCNIPMECQKWYFERLLTLIRVCSFKNQPKKKQSLGQMAARNRALNEARRKASGSNG